MLILQPVWRPPASPEARVASSARPTRSWAPSSHDARVANRVFGRSGGLGACIGNSRGGGIGNSQARTRIPAPSSRRANADPNVPVPSTAIVSVAIIVPVYRSIQRAAGGRGDTRSPAERPATSRPSDSPMRDGTSSPIGTPHVAGTADFTPREEHPSTRRECVRRPVRV